MGKINFIRIFILDFSIMVKPIHNMLKKDRSFSWNDTTKKDFVEIKNAISNKWNDTSILAMLDF
jgi:hypothetical protein